MYGKGLRHSFNIHSFQKMDEWRRSISTIAFSFPNSRSCLDSKTHIMISTKFTNPAHSFYRLIYYATTAIYYMPLVLTKLPSFIAYCNKGLKCYCFWLLWTYNIRTLTTKIVCTRKQKLRLAFRIEYKQRKHQTGTMYGLSMDGFVFKFLLFILIAYRIRVFCLQ